MFQYRQVTEQVNMSWVLPIRVARAMLPKNINVDDESFMVRTALSDEEITQSVVPSVVLVLCMESCWRLML